MEDDVVEIKKKQNTNKKSDHKKNSTKHTKKNISDHEKQIIIERINKMKETYNIDLLRNIILFITLCCFILCVLYIIQLFMYRKMIIYDVISNSNHGELYISFIKSVHEIN